jgi:hypothetical protein
MARDWTHTRQVLQQLPTTTAAAYLTRLAFKSPHIITQARTLLQRYPLHDDRFKIEMIHYLRHTLPGGMDALYNALLQDIMADRPRLEA